MKNLRELKIFTATYIAESDIPVKDKLWLIDFVKEGEYNDIIDILEGEYQLPQISDYLAEKLWRALKGGAKEASRILKGQARTPPIPKKKPGAKPLRVRGNMGWSKYSQAKQTRKAADKDFRKFMPDASKESVKGVKHAIKPLKKAERRAAGAALVKTGTAAGGVALAGVGGHSVYKQHMSQAARACKGKPDREGCMSKYRKKALASKNIHKIKRLRVSKSDCVNARNPVKCRQRIDSRVNKLKEDLDILLISERGFMGPFGRALDIFFIFELGQMAYKRFFSRAAKACKGSPDRKLCVLRYKVKAKEAQIRVLKSKAGLCAKDANPSVCKNKLLKKLQSLKSDVTMLRQELV